MTRRLRVGLVLQGSSRWVGGVQYGQNLYHALRALPAWERAAFEVVPLAAGPLEDDLYRDMPAAFHHSLVAGLPPAAPAARGKGLACLRRLWPFGRAQTLAEAARRLGVDFLYPHLPGWGEPGRRGWAAWIYDFQHKHLPGLFAPEEIARRDRAFARAARRAPRVVLSSEDARRDFARYFPRAEHKARVLSFCTAGRDDWYAADPLQAAQAHGLPERFFLTCNQFWQHKNHQVVFQALERLRRRGTRPTLVCTGALLDSRRPGYADVVRGQIADGGLADQVRLLGLVPRAEQVQLVRQAVAVIQPSLFEGWSTVVEDARALGKVVALSRLAVHQEQAPPQAAYFDPHDPGALADVLEDWWRHRPAGPDHAAESAARADNARRLVALGRQFLRIARECL